MIEILKALILGIVQGLTEFLPVSSSGHLIFLQKMGVGEPSMFFDLMLHMGTLIAACITLFKPIINTLKSFEEILKVLISSIPTFIIALLFKLFFNEALEGAILGVGFLVTAVVLVLTETLKKGSIDKEIERKRALLVGIMQGIAVLPGVSRSGMTIGFLRGTGVEGSKAAEYSFIIGMPVILGGILIEMLPVLTGEAQFEIISNNWSAAAVFVGIIAAFISGLFAIRVMLKVFAKKSLIPFAVYVTILAVISFIAF